MKLIFSIHFQQAVIERNISVDHLKKAIREPDESHPIFGGRIVSRKLIDGRILEVVYVRGGKNEYRIITSYYILNS